ncbi:hypothetical protein E2C01_097584 [Portunus trituberculatus]|uniref:Uncharacterized protein n=1 Tax=Portunus trituberculatus TaxID=210409 RepID=A0A5B7KAC2_PORTR|nr:hypothetical protein [Portunus trituberculatus]
MARRPLDQPPFILSRPRSSPHTSTLFHLHTGPASGEEPHTISHKTCLFSEPPPTGLFSFPLRTRLEEYEDE